MAVLIGIISIIFITVGLFVLLLWVLKNEAQSRMKDKELAALRKYQFEQESKKNQDAESIKALKQRLEEVKSEHSSNLAKKDADWKAKTDEALIEADKSMRKAAGLEDQLAEAKNENLKLQVAFEEANLQIKKDQEIILKLNNTIKALEPKKDDKKPEVEKSVQTANVDPKSLIQTFTPNKPTEKDQAAEPKTEKEMKKEVSISTMSNIRNMLESIEKDDKGEKGAENKVT